MEILKVFKRQASMWFQYKEGTKYVEGVTKSRDPCIFLSFTPSSGSREYSRDDAIVIALNYWDVTAIVDGCKEGFLDAAGEKRSVSIIHNYDGTIKSLRVGAGNLDDDGRPTYGWYLKVGDDSYTVFTSDTEMYGGGKLGICGYLLNCGQRMLND